MSAPMVRALLAGTKTQTRRIVKEQPCGCHQFATGGSEGLVIVCRACGDSLIRCPYGVPGDTLWVREDHYRFGHWEPVPGVRTKTGRMKWRFVADTDEVLYDAPASFRKGRHHKDFATPAWHKRLGRFMPRAFSRLTLTLTDVRVERLQEISEADAKAEGVTFFHVTPGSDPQGWYPEGYRTNYRATWESINGPGSWDANVWVWVLTFRVEK